MAREATIIIGSGINPLKKDVPYNSTSQERHLRGTATVLLNPEDASAGGSGLVTQITVGTTVTKLPPTPLVYRRGLAIFNNDNNRTLYIGFDPSITTGTGWPVPPGTSLPMDVNGQIEVYGIADQDVDIRILELS